MQCLVSTPSQRVVRIRLPPRPRPLRPNRPLLDVRGVQLPSLPPLPSSHGRGTGRPATIAATTTIQMTKTSTPAMSRPLKVRVRISALAGSSYFYVFFPFSKRDDIDSLCISEESSGEATETESEVDEVADQPESTRPKKKGGKAAAPASKTQQNNSAATNNGLSALSAMVPQVCMVEQTLKTRVFPRRCTKFEAMHILEDFV